MQTLNGHLTQAGVTRNVSKVQAELTPPQAELIQFITHHDAEDLSRSLKRLHVAFYHSQASLTEADKDVLYDVRLLWECLDRIVE